MTDDDDRTDIEKAFDRLTGRLGEAFDKFKNPGAQSPAPAGATGDAVAPEVKQAFNTDAFFKAVKLGKAADVQKMIEDGFDPNTYNTAGLTALHVTARNNNMQAVAEVLLRYGANPKLPLKEDNTTLPIDDAVNFGKHDIVDLLTRHGGYIPGNTVNGRSLLHRACEKGKARTVESLVKAGADANERTENGSTPLLVAVFLRQTDVAQLLLNFPDVMAGVNEYFASTDPLKRNAFQLAVERGQSALIGRMLQGGADVNVRDSENMTPLHHAVAQGDVELVKTLLAHHPDLNKTIGGQSTPLMLACTTDSLADNSARATIISLLLEAGADPEVPDGDGRRPLHALMRGNDADAARVLLQYPVEKDATDRFGASALFYALEQTSPDALALLLAAGADPNARNMKDARTPLIEAVQQNNAPAVRLLLEKGANPKLLDATHKSALSYAREKNDSVNIHLLEDALRKISAPQKRKNTGFKEFDL